MTAKGNKIHYDFNAYRRDVMAALGRTKLSGADFRAILLILAQTNGYLRPEDKMKVAFFREKVGLYDSNLRRTIGRLRSWNMISKKGQYYAVLPPKQWKPECFLECFLVSRNRNEMVTQLTPGQEGSRNEIDTVSTLSEPLNRNEMVTEPTPAESPKRNEIVTPSVTKSLHQPHEIVTDLASSKDNLSKDNLSKDNIYIVMFDFWNSLKIIQHKQLTDEMRRALKLTLKEYTREEIYQAMKNYAEIVQSGDYFFKYRWTFKDFLKRGLEKFLDLEVALNNYRRGAGDKKIPTADDLKKGVNGEQRPRQERANPITYIRGSEEVPEKD